MSYGCGSPHYVLMTRVRVSEYNMVDIPYYLLTSRARVSV